VDAEQGILLRPFDQGRVIGLEEPGDRDTTASSIVEKALRAWPDRKGQGEDKKPERRPSMGATQRSRASDDGQGAK